MYYKRKAGAKRGPRRDGATRLIESRIVLELQSARGIRIYRDMMLDSTVVCRRALGCEWGGCIIKEGVTSRGRH